MENEISLEFEKPPKVFNEEIGEYKFYKIKVTRLTDFLCWKKGNTFDTTVSAKSAIDAIELVGKNYPKGGWSLEII